MKSYEIYKAADPAIIEEMLMFFREEDRNLYKTTLATLAANKKLRLVFLQKKPVSDQVKWMHQALMFRPNADVGEHMFQIWFMKAKSEVLVTSCDALGIPHNGEGYVEGSLPTKLDDKKLKTAVDELLAKYGAPLTSVYLAVFNLQIQGGWDNLAEIIANDDRLAFQGGAKPSEEKPAKKASKKSAKKAPAKKAVAKKAAKKKA